MKKFTWLVPALLLAGCRSEQVAFQFRPAAATLAASGGVGAAAVAVPAPVTASAPPVAASLAEAGVVAPAASAKPAAPGRPALAARVAVMPIARTQRLARHLGRRRATEGAAENGLGGIGLFFIGVVLAIVAGLGALVNVIFSVGFFTGVGYAAAGLVVLALLYSLLSGGEKKQRRK